MNRRVRLSGIGFAQGVRFLTVLLFVALGAAILGWLAPVMVRGLYDLVTARHLVDMSQTRPDSAANVIPIALLGGILGALISKRVIRSSERLAHAWERMDPGDKVTYFVGVFAGLIISVPSILIFQALNVDSVYRVLLILGVNVGLASLSIYVLQSIAEFLPWNRNKTRGKRSGIKLLDTNVIIDGRIYDVARTGFLEGQLYVPNFVLEELQYIADSHDPLRRQRGRRGLEVLKHMQADFPMEVGTYDRFAPDPNEEVDARLVRLARALGADIVTNDFNLNRVATLQDVRVMSLNDLAMALRTNILPQETLQSLKIIREGNQLGQGVGYLEDGTMVVVENGQAHIGESMDVLVTQVIQTERGKMIFAEVDGGPAPVFETRRRRNSR